MNPLEQLTKTALLGTQRSQLDSLEFESDNLRQIWDEMRNELDEHRLLSTVGMLHLYEQIGQAPRQRQRAVTPPLQINDPRKACSDETAEFLFIIMAGRHRDCLPELFNQIEASQQRISDICLPNLLNYGQRFSRLRPRVVSLLGPRGRWLAAQHPGWRYGILDQINWLDQLDEWSELKITERSAIARQLRETNPKLGRQLIESRWKTDSDNNRYHLIKQFEHGLTMQDEPFLERALDDRAIKVRRQAVELLARLPHSRRGQRMTNYADQILKWRPRTSFKIDVRFPAQLKPDMLRDGMAHTEKKIDSRYVSRQLIVLMSGIPLDYWTSNWNQDVSTILKGVAKSRWPRTLRTGFIGAARRQENADWCLELVKQDNFTSTTQRLIKYIRYADRVALVKMVRNQKTTKLLMAKGQPLFLLLQQSPTDWDLEMSRFWIDQIIRFMNELADSKLSDPNHRSLYMRFCRHVPIELAAEIEYKLRHTVNPDAAVWQKLAKDMINIIHFRQQYLSAFERTDQTQS